MIQHVQLILAAVAKFLADISKGNKLSKFVCLAAIANILAATPNASTVCYNYLWLVYQLTHWVPLLTFFPRERMPSLKCRVHATENINS